VAPWQTPRQLGTAGRSYVQAMEARRTPPHCQDSLEHSPIENTNFADNIRILNSGISFREGQSKMTHYLIFLPLSLRWSRVLLLK
jgi:hypothetical protein